MKNILSLIACAIICAVLVQYRVTNSDITAGKPPLKITEWDAFGYYMYLPAGFIYHDYKKLNWVPDIDKKYSVTGGNGVQAQKQDNGNYVFKYLGGVAILETPLFLTGHYIAKHYGYPADGFSPPYQYTLGFGIILYCFLATLLLRKILLRYFKDSTVAITLLMVCLATNFIQYAAVHNAMSHAYIFPLYVLVLYATIKWHQKPGIAWAVLIGYIVGLASICRPTEAIMLFIPLLWNTHTKETAKEKWALVQQHKNQLACAICFGFIGILPQLIYWKITSGSFIYDVGSSWDFLTPHFRVLFGWEKGWFIYTPVAILFIIGMFYMKQLPFKRSVLWFCLLNIYIVISWRDWHYGASYSTRALVESYPILALPFAALVEHISYKKWRAVFYLICAWLLIVNLFQTTQYNTGVLHYDEMNRHYYSRIFLNLHPSPTDMSLLDNNELLNHEAQYHKHTLAHTDTTIPVHFEGNASAILIPPFTINTTADTWLKIECTIKAPGCLWQSYLNATLQTGDSIKHARVRLLNAISPNDSANNYAFYMTVPDYFKHSRLTLSITGTNFNGIAKEVVITEFDK